MRIRKYDFNWGRRELMKKAAVGASAGLLMPLSKVIAEGKDLSKAYPDELLSIDVYTKGKIKTGDMITADNVDVVKDLLDPITFTQIKTMGRKIKIKKTSTNPTEWFPAPYYEATQKNKKDGNIAGFDKDGNVVNTKDGGAWPGGLPFPDAKDGLEAQANLALSWGRHDYSQYAIQERDLGPDGKPSYSYDFVWAELQVSGRNDGKVFQNRKDLLRYQTVFFTNTSDVAGTSFMSTWYADQRKFPQLIGYLPQFRRTRTFPASQRFEPLIPGVTWFLSDAWAAGDPTMTWGDFKFTGPRKPMLSTTSAGWDQGNNKDWIPKLHGGPQGRTFYDTTWELVPEIVVQSSKPTHYPRAPVGYRLTWMDPRMWMFPQTIRYDRNGKEWVSFQPGFSQYKTPDGKKVLKDKNGNPEWSWLYVQAYDMQRNRMSQICHADTCFGGYKSVWDLDNQEMYQKYFTQEAIQRLGTV